MSGDLRKNWLLEYERKGIPSSFKSEPSEALVVLAKFLLEHGVEGGRALDLGCGKGRNSIFLAKNGFEVYAIDFVPQLVEELNAFSASSGLKITGICQSVTEKLPIEAKSCDVAVDVYCYKHQADKNSQKAYRSELARVLKDGGYYLLSLAGDDDGFYGPLLKNSPDAKNKMIIDPVTRVPSYLYSRQDVEKEFSDYFEVVQYHHKRKRGPMHGGEYDRSTLMFVMRKKPA